ncbi:MarR family winged helix-turn-helix transcriptional regulator [Nonomuraea jiangxiensis]|uniref:DNA-binding transcriptional regulator, MarR family n=1 Tax=Nonomuraea jiangxiensis TaxID=633440 RepID=A0A1G9J2E5_9ACTN|nr:MarR family transcriptional regulator [Nonomuraea jiangxiensis]SDL31482.1 DNA-binding transcriptional regulator, MarR family [Nonomuraea jiangxiensis]
MGRPSEALTEQDYANLLSFRVWLRAFLWWSEQRAAEVGLTAAQHQLLLAVRGHSDSRGPTIRELAGYLCTRHHSAVQLADRVERLGLIRRNRVRAGDRREVRLTLTEAGRLKLSLLSAAHLEELRRLAPLLNALFELPNRGGRMLLGPLGQPCSP